MDYTRLSQVAKNVVKWLPEYLDARQVRHVESYHMNKDYDYLYERAKKTEEGCASSFIGDENEIFDFLQSVLDDDFVIDDIALEIAKLIIMNRTLNDERVEVRFRKDELDYMKFPKGMIVKNSGEFTTDYDYIRVTFVDDIFKGFHLTSVYLVKEGF